MLWPIGLHICLSTDQVVHQEAGSSIMHDTGHMPYKEQACLDLKSLLNELDQRFASGSSMRHALSIHICLWEGSLAEQSLSSAPRCMASKYACSSRASLLCQASMRRL